MLVAQGVMTKTHRTDTLDLDDAIAASARPAFALLVDDGSKIDGAAWLAVAQGPD